MRRSILVLTPALLAIAACDWQPAQKQTTNAVNDADGAATNAAAANVEEGWPRTSGNGPQHNEALILNNQVANSVPDMVK